MGPFDIVKKYRILPRPVCGNFQIDPFTFHHAKKSFTRCIVGTMAHRTHTADQKLPAEAEAGQLMLIKWVNFIDQRWIKIDGH
jgi:hypothetical protein